MKVGDLVRMKKGFSPVGLVVDIIKQVDPFGSISVLWSDDMGKSLEFPKDLKLVE